MMIAIWVLGSVAVVLLAAFTGWALVSSTPLEFPHGFRGAAAYKGGVEGDVCDVLRNELDARKAATVPGRVVCPECHREVPVRDSGQIRRHRAFATARSAVCAGSGRHA